MADILILPAEPLAVGRVVRVETGDANSAAIEWLIPPQDDRAEIFEYPNHLLVNPLVAGPIVVGYKVEGKPSWITLTAGTVKRSWSLGWLKKLVPSWGTATKALPWLIALVLLAVVVMRPAPGPNPKPPGPIDPPTPAPIPASGLRVMVIHESTEGAALLTPKQVDELWGEEFQSFTRAKCAKGADGKTPEYLIVDKDVPLGKTVSEPMRAAFARPRTEVPWIIVSNGKTGFEGRLPNGGILELVKRYAQ